MEVSELLQNNANIMLSIKAGDLKKVIQSKKRYKCKYSGTPAHYYMVLPPFVNGLKGIRELFGVSHVTAQKYKNTWLAPAVTQQGKILLTDTEMALKLFAEYNEGGR